MRGWPHLRERQKEKSVGLHACLSVGQFLHSAQATSLRTPSPPARSACTQVENPIPFAPSSLVRKLTAGHLHSRYAGLLLLPLRLSADWSFACIPYVETLGDPRNLGTAALYLCLAYLVAAARPWELLPLPWDRERQSRAAEPGEHLHAARWRLAVAAGLVVAPFFPASNVLFYVGTSIGERLLYCPSVGFCLLAAEPLAAALRPLLRAEAPAAAAQDGGGSKEVPAPASKPAAAAAKTAAAATAAPQGGGGRAASRAAQARAVVVAALLAAYLAFFCGKTLLRNREWRDEETLFRAAERVSEEAPRVGGFVALWGLLWSGVGGTGTSTLIWHSGS